MYLYIYLYIYIHIYIFALCVCVNACVSHFCSWSMSKSFPRRLHSFHMRLDNIFIFLRLNNVSTSLWLKNVYIIVFTMSICVWTIFLHFYGSSMSLRDCGWTMSISSSIIVIAFVQYLYASDQYIYLIAVPQCLWTMSIAPSLRQNHICMRLQNNTHTHTHTHTHTNTHTHTHTHTHPRTPMTTMSLNNI